MYKIVIPDIHQDMDSLKNILYSSVCKEAQEVIFLGDYFDSHVYDFLVKEMCDFLNTNIQNDRYTFLLGNHDTHYLTKVNDYYCSGWTRDKQRIIDDHLDRSFMKKVKPFKFEVINSKEFLFSHAGIHPAHLPVYFNTMDRNNWFATVETDIMDSLFHSHSHPLLRAGRDRCGPERHGGLTWLDWGSFISVDGLYQVVGHSKTTVPRWRSYNNINIDTGLQHFLKVDSDGNMEILKNE